MIDRVSSQAPPMLLRDNALSLQRALARANGEVGSGRHADLAEALGAGLSRDAQAHARAATLEAFDAQDNVAGARLDALTTTLGHLRGLAVGLRDQLVAATQSPQTRAGLIEAAKGFLASYMDAMNRDVGGVALFGGKTLDVPSVIAYESGPASVVAAAFQAEFGMTQDDPAVGSIAPDAMAAFIDGRFAAAFDPAAWSANWSRATDDGFRSQIAPGESAQTTASANDAALRDMARLAVMVADLGGDKLNDAAFAKLAGRAGALASSVIDGATTIEARMGVARKRVSDAQIAMSATRDLLMRQIGSMEDVDPTEAATRVNDLTARLEATFAVTARMRDLSLLKYL